jgi:hypothetical protein
MNTTDIICQRLMNQQVGEPHMKQAQEVVQWLVAMQAQEYAMAKWAIGLRTTGLTDAAIERSFNEGCLLRTHLLRCTWHFVAPADIRWLLALTAPRVRATLAYYDRMLEIDSKLLKRTNTIVVKALQGGKQLTRVELRNVLEKAKIKADGQRLGHLLIHAELNALICSGARKGKQFTYALLDERVPEVKSISRADALAAFVNRYFTSRGPATLHDFASWSGLTITDAKKGAEALDSHFLKESINGQEYIFPLTVSKPLHQLQATFLMPDYDEYGMSYKDRSHITAGRKIDATSRTENPVFNRMMVADGIIVGTWKRTVEGKKVIVETVPFSPLTKAKEQAMKKAVKRFVAFAGEE